MSLLPVSLVFYRTGLIVKQLAIVPHLPKDTVPFSITEENQACLFYTLRIKLVPGF